MSLRPLAHIVPFSLTRRLRRALQARDCACPHVPAATTGAGEQRCSWSERRRTLSLRQLEAARAFGLSCALRHVRCRLKLRGEGQEPHLTRDVSFGTVTYIIGALDSVSRDFPRRNRTTQKSTTTLLYTHHVPCATVVSKPTQEIRDQESYHPSTHPCYQSAKSANDIAQTGPRQEHPCRG